MTMRDLIKYGFNLDDKIYITVALFDENGVNVASEELQDFSNIEFTETCDGDIVLCAIKDV